jgi:hypothetical protein
MGGIDQEPDVPASLRLVDGPLHELPAQPQGERQLRDRPVIRPAEQVEDDAHAERKTFRRLGAFEPADGSPVQRPDQVEDLAELVHEVWS